MAIHGNRADAIPVCLPGNLFAALLPSVVSLTVSIPLAYYTL
jgi:hypothetical protein